MFVLATTASLHMLGCGGGPRVAAPSGLSYAQASVTATLNVAIAMDMPSVTGTVTSYSVSPALPAGLSLNAATGAITGTPTALAVKAAYIVTAANSGGAATTTIQLAVVVAPPTNLSYGEMEIAATAGQAIAPDVPAVTGTVTSYSVNPSLPAGLNLDTSVGIISGTPTAASAKASYVISATNASGSTSATVQITVAVAPPTGLMYPQTIIGTWVGREITPDIPGSAGGPITSYSITPALPAGLAMDAATGVISGTPTAEAPTETYTVTGSNVSGSVTAAVSPTITVTEAPNILLQLGNQDGIATLQLGNSRVFSQGWNSSMGGIQGELWTLWDYDSGAIVASGDAANGEQNMAYSSSMSGMAGATLAIGVPGGIEVRSSSDGHLVSTIISPAYGMSSAGGQLEQSDAWQLAPDGSYLWIATASGLFVYSSSGQLLFSLPGSFYAETMPTISAEPGQIQIANGPAGNFIQTISVPGGVSTLSLAYNGTFLGFMGNGEFLTDEGTTILIYSGTGVQVGSFQVPEFSGTLSHSLAVAGNWVYTLSEKSIQDTEITLNIYPAGSSTPVMTKGEIARVYSYGALLALQLVGSSGVSLIDLSGSAPVETDYPAVPSFQNFAGISSAEWVIGTSESGIIVDGASLTGSPRYICNGSTGSIVGGTERVGIAVATGQFTYFDPSNPTPEGSLGPIGKAGLSSDGSVLAASSPNSSLLQIYALPAGTVSNTISYTGSLYDFALSGSGTMLAQVVQPISTSYSLTMNLAPISGSPTVLSLPLNISWYRKPAISPDGTLVAVNNNAELSSSTVAIYQNGNLMATVPGVQVGWIDNDRLLVSTYADENAGPTYTGATIYSPAGIAMATPPLPELWGLQPVGSDTIYSSQRNAIYSVSTGQATWTSPYPPDPGNNNPLLPAGIGAVSGPYVVFESEGDIVAVKY